MPFYVIDDTNDKEIVIDGGITMETMIITFVSFLVVALIIVFIGIKINKYLKAKKDKKY